MTKDVWITIKGCHEVEGEAQEPVMTELRGRYDVQGGKHYLRFEEEADSGDVTRTMMKFKEGYLEVTKKGGVTSNMRFEAGKRNTTHYRTPVGNLEMGIEAAAVTVTQEPRRIRVDASYALYAMEQKVQDSRIEIVVIPYPIV